MDHKEYLAFIGAKGGKARKLNLSKKQLTAIGKLGGRPRKNPAQ